jgi:DNA polymerase
VPDLLGIDYETFSAANLKEVGSSEYARHPSTEVLMAAYNVNGGAMRQWIPAEGQDMPRELDEALDDPEVQKWAWNAPFEMNITRNVLKRKIDVRQWRDTMVLGLYCSMPGQLEKAGPALGLDDDKLKVANGKKLIKKFSVLQKSRRKADFGAMTRTYWYDGLEDWEDYLFYNRGDVKTEQAIRDKLMKHNLPDDEWELWFLDQKINEAGLPINLDMVKNATEVYSQAFARGVLLMRQITGLDNPMSTQQLLPWLRARGYMFEDCKAGHIRQAAGYYEQKPAHWTDDDHAAYVCDSDLAEVLQLRLELSRTSIKKFDALLRSTGKDGLLRYTLQFMGAARTARWAGRIYQPQNLPRPNKQFEKGIEIHAANIATLELPEIDLIYNNVFDLLASTLRPAAQAPDGYVFIDADLNAIENRVLGWLANCPKIMRVFELKRDPYIDFGTYLFNREYDELMAEYKAGDSSKRTIAKPGVLGCGYMLGPGKEFEDKITGEIEGTGLLGYAWGMGVKQFTLQDSKLSVDTFRREFKEVKDYWYGIERAARKCIQTGAAVGYGAVTFDIKGQFMRMQLPSGRYLHYYKPELRKTKMPWKQEDGSPAYKMAITYEGMNDKKQWFRQSTHPGKITENADQAIARDLLAHGMKLADQRGIDMRLHVHDQIIGLVKEEHAEAALELLIECMEEPPVWAKGLPLGSNGFITKVFKKD